MLSLQYRLLFIHQTEHASYWSVDCSLTSLSPLGAQTPPPTPSGHWLLMVMTTQKYFTLGAGPAFCGSVNNGRSRNAMSFRPTPLTPLLFLTLLVVSANREEEHYWKHRGVFVYCRHKMHLLFSTILTVGAPKILVKKWWILAFVFTFQWLSTPVYV